MLLIGFFYFWSARSRERDRFLLFPTFQVIYVFSEFILSFWSMTLKEALIHSLSFSLWPADLSSIDSIFLIVESEKAILILLCLTFYMRCIFATRVLDLLIYEIETHTWILSFLTFYISCIFHWFGVSLDIQDWNSHLHSFPLWLLYRVDIANEFLLSFWSAKLRQIYWYIDSFSLQLFIWCIWFAYLS
jgi:hypothetical protein